MTDKKLLIISVLLIVAVVAASYWVFMKAPKMSARDKYHSLGNVGIQQQPTGKNYPYRAEAPVKDDTEDAFISNAINYGKSDSVTPAAYPAATRALLFGK